MITEQQFNEICPNASPDLVPHLTVTLHEFEIVNKLRKAAFIAQLAHESAEFTRFEENLNYSAKGLYSTFRKYFPTMALAEVYARQPEKIANRVYANRMGNGPEASGDGWKHRGRGPIQLTGKANYTTYGKLLKLDLLTDPNVVKKPEVGFRVGGAFWMQKKLNVMADARDFIGITKAINGGLNGLEEREKYYKKALAVLA